MTMKFLLPLAVFTSLLAPAMGQPTATIATQTFFIPMPEDMIFFHTFKNISNDALSPVNTLVSLAVSTDDTIVYYDHWEDGFEKDATNPATSTTQIWGDGKASNGCAPRKNVACSDANDKLMAGDAIVIQSTVPVPRVKANILFDGGDRIQATYPIAITRGAYPDGAGSLMAGAIEVLEKNSYGKEFIAPAGWDTVSPTSAFEYSALYVLASEDGTTVTYPGGTAQLNMGQSVVLTVKQSDKITATKPVLVDLITGDKGSTYQLRWYSLLSTDQWSNEYVSSVGDSVGNSKVLLYNPGTSSLTVNYEYLVAGAVKTANVTLAAGKNAYSVVIPTGSGARFYATSNFMALSLTDTVGGGQIYDWGCPVMPRAHLTPQVLIGLGFGCTDNDCGTEPERSVVWLTPVEDCVFHVDTDGNGVSNQDIPAKKLSSTMVRDPADKDMSGALIWATKTSSLSSAPVDFAAAWGQNPDDSFSGDEKALDLGTVVLPFTTVRVGKFVKLIEDNDKNGGASAGDKLEYTIQIINNGQVDVPLGGFTIKDPTLNQATYVAGSFTYTELGVGLLPVNDDAQGTPFPLDGAGLVSKSVLKRRGGTHELKFKVVVAAGASGTIINQGTLEQSGGPTLPFETSIPVTGPLVWTKTPEGSCMYDNWKNAGKTGTLSCTAKNVYVEKISAMNLAQCVKGKPIKLSLSATVNFNGAKYDPGWYIATDGGDALTGKCAVASLEQKYAGALQVVESAGSNKVVGNVTWTQDNIGGNDECGDVSIPAGGGVLDYNLMIDTEMTCTDDDNDGKMDFAICFSWKEKANDSWCSVAAQLAQGKTPAIYPGTTSSCFCAQVEVPNVVVLDAGDKVYPCV